MNRLFANINGFSHLNPPHQANIEQNNENQGP